MHQLEARLLVQAAGCAPVAIKSYVGWLGRSGAPIEPPENRPSCARRAELLRLSRRQQGHAPALPLRPSQNTHVMPASSGSWIHSYAWRQREDTLYVELRRVPCLQLTLRLPTQMSSSKQPVQSTTQDSHARYNTPAAVYAPSPPNQQSLRISCAGKGCYSAPPDADSKSSAHGEARQERKQHARTLSRR